MKNKLAAVIHVTAPHAHRATRASAWLTLATSSIVIADHLLSKKSS